MLSARDPRAPDPIRGPVGLFAALSRPVPGSRLVGLGGPMRQGGGGPC